MSQQLQFCSAKLSLRDGSQPAVPQPHHSAQRALVIQHRDAHPPNLTGVGRGGKAGFTFRASSSPHPSNPFPLKSAINLRDSSMLHQTPSSSSPPSLDAGKTKWCYIYRVYSSKPSPSLDTEKCFQTQNR